MTPSELYRRFAEVFNRRDFDALLEITVPAVSIESRFSSVAGQTYRGQEAVRTWWADLAEAWESIEVEVQEVFEDPDGIRARALSMLHGVGRGSGIEVHEPVAHVTDWQDGRMLRLRYEDRATAEAAWRAPPAQVATFDCYGTLIDWEGGLGTFLYSLARRHGDARPEPGRVLRERWEAIQFRLITGGPWRRYKEVLHDALREWCGERGYRWNTGDGDALVESMRAWQPFPDTAPALRAARERGMRLVIVSNTDGDIIEHSLRQIDVPFDDIVTAEDARAYKPDEAVFRRALEHIGEPPEAVLHVAFGFKYDIGPARRLGMRTAWVNRHAEPPPGAERPDHEWRDLWGLTETAAPRP